LNGRWAGRRLKPVKPRNRNGSKKGASTTGVRRPRWSGERVTIRSRTDALEGDKSATDLAAKAGGRVSRQTPTGRRRAPKMPPWTSATAQRVSSRAKRRRVLERQTMRPRRPRRRAPIKSPGRTVIERAMRPIDSPSRDSDDILIRLGWTRLPDGTPVPPL
jgi:hypothetical protein